MSKPTSLQTGQSPCNFVAANFPPPRLALIVAIEIHAAQPALSSKRSSAGKYRFKSYERTSRAVSKDKHATFQTMLDTNQLRWWPFLLFLLPHFSMVPPFGRRHRGKRLASFLLLASRQRNNSGYDQTDRHLCHWNFLGATRGYRKWPETFHCRLINFPSKERVFADHDSIN